MQAIRTAQAISRIEQALTMHSMDRRIYLKDLWRDVQDLVDHAEFSRLILQAQADGLVVLMRLDDPQEIRPEDEEAAINIMGNKRHILYRQ